MRRVLDHFGVRKAVVAGRDWGGGVALEFALREPGRVRALLGSVVSYRDEAGLSRLRKLVSENLFTKHMAIGQFSSDLVPQIS